MTGTTTVVLPTGQISLYAGTSDDGWFLVQLPFYVRWNGGMYNVIWVSTNSYVLFNNYMNPSYESAGPFSAANWNYPGNSKIFISAADNSTQRVTITTKYSGPIPIACIRYEGCSWTGTSTPVGQSNIIWELNFYDDPAYYNKAILDIILNGRLTNDQTSYSALCGASTQLQSFVPSTGTSWLLELQAGETGASISSLVYRRKKKLVVSGTVGVMVIGDEELPVGTDATKTGGAIADPETYRTQLYFHSNLPYIKIESFTSIPSVSFPELTPDLRTWSDGGGGHGGC